MQTNFISPPSLVPHNRHLYESWMKVLIFHSRICLKKIYRQFVSLPVKKISVLHYYLIGIWNLIRFIEVLNLFYMNLFYRPVASSLKWFLQGKFYYSKMLFYLFREICIICKQIRMATISQYTNCISSSSLGRRNRNITINWPSPGLNFWIFIPECE